MRVLPVLAAVLLAYSGVAQAQLHCAPSDSLETCSSRLAGQLEDQGKEAMKGGVAVKNTGGDAASSTINDFLPLLRALVDTGGLSGEDGKLELEWSNPLGLPKEEQNKLTIGLTKSELHEPLKDALRAASLEDEIGALEDDIDEGDDISIGFSYSRASQSYGRDPRLQSDIVSELLKVASVDAGEITSNSALTNFEQMMLSQNGNLDFDGQKPFQEIGFRNPEEMNQYIRLVEDALQAHHKSMRAFGERLRTLGFYRFLDLVNNQPQWSVTADYHSRDESVGPDEFTAVVSYEKGWANVNAYRAHRRTGCSGVAEADCLARYLNDPEVVANLEQSLRVNVKAEYAKFQSLSFSLPSTTFTYEAKSSERFSLSAGIGRYVGREIEGLTRVRVDASLSYEDFSDDPARQDRGLATVTMTYPVSEGFYLSIGAVYASKPEFRGDVDEEISARAGLSYKLLASKE